MATQKNIFNSSDFSATWISEPGLKGQGRPGIIVFSDDNGTYQKNQNSADTALLMDSCTVAFNRGVQRRYFLNQAGGAYLVGVGNGTLQVSGLLGSAESFGKLFGGDDICKNKRNVKLVLSGMKQCDATTTKADAGSIELKSVLPTGVSITASIQGQDGILYFNATATFTFTGMTITGEADQPATGGSGRQQPIPGA